MASYQCHRYHIIFSTKGRQPFIVESIEHEVWAYLTKLGRDKGLKVYIVGGFDDHVHIYCGIPASMAVSDAVQELKGASSRWLNLHFENTDLGWQSSYASFTINASLHERTRRYIKTQRAHHQHKSFEEEMNEIVALHEKNDSAY